MICAMCGQALCQTWKGCQNVECEQSILPTNTCEITREGFRLSREQELPDCCGDAVQKAGMRNGGRA